MYLGVLLGGGGGGDQRRTRVDKRESSNHMGVENTLEIVYYILFSLYRAFTKPLL